MLNLSGRSLASLMGAALFLRKFHIHSQSVSLLGRM